MSRSHTRQQRNLKRKLRQARSERARRRERELAADPKRRGQLSKQHTSRDNKRSLRDTLASSKPTYER